MQKNSAQADLAGFTRRVRSIRAYKFYEDRLKKYRIFKLPATFVWKNIQFLYLLPWIYIKALKYPLVQLSAHTAQLDKTFLTKDETVITPKPEVFPVSNKITLTSPHSEYKFPGIYIAEVSNALVTGATNLVMADDEIICHDLYDFRHDHTSEELNGRTFIWPGRQCIAWLMRTVPDDAIEQGACFTDACAHNYAHWMTEVLPRVSQFCSSKHSEEVPILVNSGLHINIHESLSLVTGNSSEVITIDAGSALKVGKLYITSAAGYVPFERRTNRLKNHSHGVFSPTALGSMRDLVLSRLGITPRKGTKRIFIRRNSTIRNVSNAHEIEAILVAEGFTVIEPENLTFAEQVREFADAETVVGATGAAFANLIFCNPSTRIIILISDYKHMPYWYWQNMACAVGNKVVYVIGTCIDSFSHIHSNFSVTPSDVLDAVDRTYHRSH